MAFLSGFLGRVISAAYPFIRLGVRLGEGIERLGSTIVRNFARLDASVVRRAIDAEVRQRAEIRSVLGRPLQDLIPDDAIPEAITKQRRNFAWQTRFGFIDPSTGRRAERFITVSTDSRLSSEEALEEARNMMEEDYEIDPSFIIDEEVIGVTRAAPGRRL